MSEKQKRPNFFVRVAKKLAKLCTDTVGELKKVSWTPFKEVRKSFRLVVGTVVAVAAILACLQTSNAMQLHACSQ